jgi:hypothetical protein
MVVKPSRVESVFGEGASDHVFSYSFISCSTWMCSTIINFDFLYWRLYDQGESMIQHLGLWIEVIYKCSIPFNIYVFPFTFVSCIRVLNEGEC